MKRGYIGTITLTVDPSTLAHCPECCQPMYCIYDMYLRPRCWDCEQTARLVQDNEKKIRKRKPRRSGVKS